MNIYYHNYYINMACINSMLKKMSLVEKYHDKVSKLKKQPTTHTLHNKQIQVSHQ